ncbi:MAG: hypothetical protein JXR51_04250, partial [Bacteroidales bacterium]|nr:hypothetical protein [Bacteroidales bacterium]
SQSNNLFRPSEIMAITKDSTKLKTYYPAASYERFVQVSSMPSFNDDKGEVVILFNDIVLDDFSYIDDMHFALISDKEGVSLERVSPLVPTADLSNWQSAAENVGFASPANINSHYVQFSDNENDEIKLEPEVFSPNNDGYDDKVFIRYNFKESGYVANVSIYNAKGRLIKRIAKNELLASQGSFSWNGLSENESISAIGIYMVYFEVFNLQGVVKKYKKTCVLAAKLN